MSIVTPHLPLWRNADMPEELSADLAEVSVRHRGHGELSCPHYVHGTQSPWNLNPKPKPWILNPTTPHPYYSEETESRTIIGESFCLFPKHYTLRAVPSRIPNRKQKQSSLYGMFFHISFIRTISIETETETGLYQSQLKVWPFVNKMWPNLFC